MAEVSNPYGADPDHINHLSEIIDFIKERIPHFETLMIVEHEHDELGRCITYTSHFTTSEENVAYALDDLDHFVDETRRLHTSGQN